MKWILYNCGLKFIGGNVNSLILWNNYVLFWRKFLNFKKKKKMEEDFLDDFVVVLGKGVFDDLKFYLKEK